MNKSVKKDFTKTYTTMTTAVLGLQCVEIYEIPMVGTFTHRLFLYMFLFRAAPGATAALESSPSDQSEVR